MRTLHVILRPVVALAVASVAAIGLTGTAVASNDYVTTVVTPTNGSVVSGDVTVTVTSTAPKVKFSFPGQTPGQGTLVPVVAGTASIVWPSAGYYFQHGIGVANCDEEGSCYAPTAGVNFDVENARPIPITPVDGATVGSTTTLTATLPDATPNAGVQFILDNAGPIGFDGTAPYEVTVSGLSEGTHSVYPVMCNAAGTVCSGGEGGWTFFTVQELHPWISSVAPMSISPNGDGRSDTTKVTYSVSNTQAASYSILRWPSRTLVRGPVNLGLQAPGKHAFVWNGTDDSAHRVSDGVYIVEVHTYRHLAGSELAIGVAADYVGVDTTPTVLTKLAGAGTAFAPKPDGYLDRFTPRVTVNEAATVYLDIVNAHGALLRRMSVYHGTPGYVPVIWNGRAANGKIVSPGNYSFRFWAQDVAGNRSFTPYYPVHVSGK